MKRISTLAAAALTAAMLSGCMFHPRGIDPVTGCRTGCSVEAIPGGPLDCCFYINALRCPILPWNWGQILNYSSCEPYGCGFRAGCGTGYRGCGVAGGFPGPNYAGGPGGYIDPSFNAYPPMLSGGDCCDAGPGMMPGMMPGAMPGMMPGYPAMSGGGCESGNCGVPDFQGVPYEGMTGAPMMAPPSGVHGPSPTFADPMMAPSPMPGALPGPTPVTPMSPMVPMGPGPAPQTSLPPATLMAPTTYVTPSSYVVPSGQRVMMPRTHSPYMQQPQSFVAPANALPLVAPH